MTSQGMSQVDLKLVTVGDGSPVATHQIAHGQWFSGPSGLDRASGRAARASAVEVVTRSGHRLVADPATEVMVARGRRLCASRLGDITSTDVAVIQHGSFWPSSSPSLEGFQPALPYGSQKQVTIPTEMTTELAFFLGAYVSEGHLNRSNWSVVITNNVPEVLERVAAAVTSCFGVAARIVEPPTRCPYVVLASKRIVELLEHLGTGHRSQVKRIPRWILRSTWEHVRAFMEGLFLDAFTAWMGKTPKWGIGVVSPGLLDDVQAVLTNLGVVHGRCRKRDSVTGNVSGEVYAVGTHAQTLLRAIPFPEPTKRARAEERLLAAPAQSTADVVPVIDPSDLAGLLHHMPRGHRSRTEFAFLRDSRTQNVSRRTLERLSAVPGLDLPDLARRILAERLHFSPIAKVATRLEVLLVSPEPRPLRSLGGFLPATVWKERSR
jgi:hypothetical protein